jgi:hypothetical protein
VSLLLTIYVLIQIPFPRKRRETAIRYYAFSLLTYSCNVIFYIHKISEHSVNELTRASDALTPQFIHPPYLYSLGYGTKTYKSRMDFRGTILIQNSTEMTHMLLGIKCYSDNVSLCCFLNVYDNYRLIIRISYYTLSSRWQRNPT